MGTDVLAGAHAARAWVPSRTTVAGSTAITATAAVVWVAATTSMVDDAYIYFRYADHLVEGHGWRYNLVGETGNAATSPLYVMLLASLHAVGVPLGAAARTLAAAGLGAAAWFGYLTFRMYGRPAATVPFMAILLAAPVGLPQVGMETSLFVGMAIATVYLFATRRMATLGVALVALTAIRGDGAILAAGYVLAAWMQDREVPWRLVTTGALVGSGWAVLQLAIVGQLVPTTMGGKVAQATSGLWPGFAEGVARKAVENPLWWAVVVATAAVGAVMLPRRRWRSAAPFVAGTVAAAVAYQALGVAFYGWYLGPVVAMLAFFAGWSAASGSSARLAVMTVLFVATAQLQPPPAGLQPIDDYEVAGDWIAANTPTDATVAAAEIGVIGWRSERCMVDFLGLLDPAAADHLADGDFSWWVSHYRPDYWVTTSASTGWVEGPALASAQGQYRPVFTHGHVTVSQRRLVASGHQGLCL